MPSLFAQVPKPVRRSLLWLVVALIVGYLVVPQLGGARQALDVLTGADLRLFAAGTVLQLSSLVAQAELTRSVLPRSNRPGVADMVRIELASTAVSHTVPGGTAAGTALAYRILTKIGVSGAAAGFAVGARGLGSAVVLNALLWAALVISIPAQGFHPLYTAAAAVGALLLGALGALVFLLIRHEKGTGRVVARVVAPLPFLDQERAPEVVVRLAERLRELGSQPRLLATTIAWSLAYWLSQAAALWLMLLAFGHSADPVSLMVAFGLSNVLAVIPITPRGLGVVEATLIPLLVGFGAGQTTASLGVLTWRLIGFWLPIPLGGLAYVSLRAVPASAGEGADISERAEAKLADLAQAAAEEAETVASWAREHGLKVPARPSRGRRRPD